MNILILGANSSVAQALVRLYSKEKHRFYLVGRDPIKLACFVDEILVGTNSGVYSEYAESIKQQTRVLTRPQYL